MYQYEIFFSNEYLFEIVDDLSKIMHLNIDMLELRKCFESNDNNLFIAYESTKSYFICIDCDNIDWIYPLIVRCNKEKKDEVNKCLLGWDNKIRDEYGQELTVFINNSYYNDDTLLQRIEKKYDVKL